MLVACSAESSFGAKLAKHAWSSNGLAVEPRIPVPGTSGGRMELLCVRTYKRRLSGTRYQVWSAMLPVYPLQNHACD
jgi:hypothetical protein